MDKLIPTKEQFKSFLRSFNTYQRYYLGAVLLLTAGFLVFLPEYMFDEETLMSTFAPLLIFFTVIDTLANPLCEVLIAKQSKINFVVDFFFIEIPELIICLTMGWYAVAMTVVLFWIPVDIVSYIRWNKHPDQSDDNLTQVKRLSAKHTVLIILAIVVFAFVVGSLMQLLPGATDSYLDAIAAGFGIANGILLLLRYSEQWYAWLITVALYIILDIMSGAYVLLVSEFAMLINTIYGIVKWHRYIKEHPNAK